MLCIKEQYENPLHVSALLEVRNTQASAYAAQKTLLCTPLFPCGTPRTCRPGCGGGVPLSSAQRTARNHTVQPTSDPAPPNRCACGSRELLWPPAACQLSPQRAQAQGGRRTACSTPHWCTAYQRPQILRAIAPMNENTPTIPISTPAQGRSCIVGLLVGCSGSYGALSAGLLPTMRGSGGGVIVSAAGVGTCGTVQSGGRGVTRWSSRRSGSGGVSIGTISGSLGGSSGAGAYSATSVSLTRTNRVLPWPSSVNLPLPKTRATVRTDRSPFGPITRTVRPALNVSLEPLRGIRSACPLTG
jgi:hypothetical protein